jgi:hypothetical protein
MVLGIPRWKPQSGLLVEKKEKKTPNGHQMVFHNSRSK